MVLKFKILLILIYILWFVLASELLSLSILCLDIRIIYSRPLLRRRFSSFKIIFDKSDSVLLIAMMQAWHTFRT